MLCSPLMWRVQGLQPTSLIHRMPIAPHSLGPTASSSTSSSKTVRYSGGERLKVRRTTRPMAMAPPRPTPAASIWRWCGCAVMDSTPVRRLALQHLSQQTEPSGVPQNSPSQPAHPHWQPISLQHRFQQSVPSSLPQCSLLFPAHPQSHSPSPRQQ